MKIDFSMFEKIGFNTVRSIEKSLLIFNCTFVSKKLFMSEDNGNVNNATPAIMQLKGKRMMFSSELKRNDKIAEAQFKKIIGGGKLVGRGLYKGMTEFDNESTVFIDTNHLPSVETAGSSAGYAIFRRIEIVPFNRRFDETERRIDLPDLLKSELVQKNIGLAYRRECEIP